ncbi:MAG: hypothetical protein J07AB43_12660, partial [Candidatus Nanosalina sp. J07AB43]
WRSIGSFEISVKDDKSLVDYLNPKWISTLLLISLLLNVGLAYRHGSENSHIGS